ncbi:MAG: hypothetical protein M3Q70_00765 [bacterium]|nr:hypothetical protein [bacterium]
MESGNRNAFSLNRTDTICLVVVLALTIGLLVAITQAGRSNKLYKDSQSEVSALKSQNGDLKATLQRRQPSSSDQVKFVSSLTPFSIEVPDNFKFLVRQDALSKNDPTTELELVTATEIDEVVTSEAKFGTTVFRVHKDVFKSRDTSTWVKNETANQIDTTKLTPETFSGTSWLSIEEPNNLAGHKITYFLLSNGYGYRANFYRLGNFDELKTFAQETMNAVSFN